jgi:hypothetical protein
MRAIGAGLVAVAAIGLLLTACSGGNDDDKTTSTTARQPTVFNVTLNGTPEMPGPGDLDGSGTAEITVDPTGTQVCYSLSVTGIDGVNAAHIHEGRAGTAGPVAITLEAPTTGRSEACTDAPASIMKALGAGTRSFYVNFHSIDFPDGAIRAQLTG